MNESEKELHRLMIDSCMACDFEAIRLHFKNGYEMISNNIHLFVNMCNHCPVETVKFLWDNQKEFKCEIDIHYNHNEAFTYACMFKNFDTAAYLILEHDIEQHPEVKAFLDEGNFEISPQIMSVISSKELNKKLNSNLKDGSKVKSLKI